MLVPMGSSGDFSGWPIGSHFVRCASAKQSHSVSVIPGWSEGPDPESRDSGFDASHRPGMTNSTKKPRQGLLQIYVMFPEKRQWASALTFFLVKYNSSDRMIRNTNTCIPIRLRSSMCGSAVHIRNVVTSLAYCATVAGEPSSNVTWPSESGFGIFMAWPGKYLL